MTKILSLAALLAVLACSAANAAILTYEPFPTAANNVYSLFLNGETTAFNGVSLSVRPDGGALFQNLSSGGPASPLPAGSPNSFRNRALDADPLDVPGGKGWSLLGVVNTTAEIAFNGGPIGQQISTAGEPGGKLFLANLMLSPGTTATANLILVNGTDTVHTQTVVFPIPEPATLALAGLGLVGLVACSRRKA